MDRAQTVRTGAPTGPEVIEADVLSEEAGLTTLVCYRSRALTRLFVETSKLGLAVIKTSTLYSSRTGAPPASAIAPPNQLLAGAPISTDESLETASERIAVTSEREGLSLHGFLEPSHIGHVFETTGGGDCSNRLTDPDYEHYPTTELVSLVAGTRFFDIAGAGEIGRVEVGTLGLRIGAPTGDLSHVCIQDYTTFLVHAWVANASVLPRKRFTGPTYVQAKGWRTFPTPEDVELEAKTFLYLPAAVPEGGPGDAEPIGISDRGLYVCSSDCETRRPLIQVETCAGLVHARAWRTPRTPEQQAGRFERPTKPIPGPAFYFPPTPPL